MNYAAKDIRDMLVDSSSSDSSDVGGLGLVFATNLFIGREPSSPNNCVTIYDTTSFPPDTTFDPTEKYYRSSVQVRIRDLSYSDAMNLGIDIMESLCGRAQETWNGTLYTVITAKGEPFLLAWDDNNRAIVIINFDMQRR